MANKQAILVLELTFLLLITLASCSYNQLDDLSSGKVSHGVQHGASKACKQAYGFLPCTSSAGGNIFLIFVYGYLIYKASKWLTEGSEVLLEINGHGVFGGLFLPLLCSLPGVLVILACGVFGSKESAQSQASIGMGLLAGTSISLLTLVWGSCVFAGKRDLNATESPNHNAISLTGSGIEIDHATSHHVWIMLMSIVPFILVLSLQLLLTSRTHLTIFIALIVSVSLLLSYCLYQIFKPWIQYRRLAYTVHKHVKWIMLWITETGEPDREALIKLFKSIDHNSDGYLSAQELRALALRVNLEDIDSDINENVNRLLDYLYISEDSLVSENEFIEGMSKFIKKKLHFEPSPTPRIKPAFRQVVLMVRTSKLFKESIQQQPRFKYTFLPRAAKRRLLMGDSKRVLERREDSTTVGLTCNLLPGENQGYLMVDEGVESNATMGILALLLGTAIAAAFAHPLANSVQSLSAATSIPSFFISFLILPFLCSSEIVPSLVLAGKKEKLIATLIFSEIYREVTMSNILYLSSLLFIVYIRDLAWSFSFEMIVVVVVCIVMGVFAGLRTTFPLWTCLVAYSLYALSLVFAYSLPIVIG